jgi:hypothetical protein
MKFSIALADLESLLKATGLTRLKKPTNFTLSACAARVFVEFQGDVSGIEAIVLSDGSVTLPNNKFREVLKTYQGTRFLTFEGSPAGLRIQNFRMPVVGYDPAPLPPAEFKIFASSMPPGPGSVSVRV